MTNQEILNQIHRGVIVSCQALPDEPLYGYHFMGHLAFAAKEGGAVGIRANTCEDIVDIKKEVDLPVIGIIKSVYDDSDVYITPTMKEIDALAATGVEIIALDATDRPRPNGLDLDTLFKEARAKYPNQLFMADCSCYEDCKHAAEIGFDLVGTTLCGYTAKTKGTAIPNYDLLSRITTELNVPVIAEGGVWERGYGDYEWRGYVPHRVMPWYFFLQSGNKTEAFGVHTQPAAMCWWTAESTGYSVYLDVRCGGLGVRLNGRTLCAAELCRAEYEDADGFTAMGEFFSVLSLNPILPKFPVYGANNWYHAYGHATEDDVLREAKALAELTEGLANRPWFIIDDCWQIDRADNYNGGPWRAGNKGFPDMPGLAKKLRESGIQPGIWVRL